MSRRLGKLKWQAGWRHMETSWNKETDRRTDRQTETGELTGARGRTAGRQVSAVEVGAAVVIVGCRRTQSYSCCLRTFTVAAGAADWLTVDVTVYVTVYLYLTRQTMASGLVDNVARLDSHLLARSHTGWSRKEVDIFYHNFMKYWP